MSEPPPPTVHRSVVALDYSQFWLSGQAEQSPLLQALLDQALNGDAVAGDEQTLLVISPHQNNFAMGLEIQHHHQPPVEAEPAGWDEVCESHLLIEPGAGLIYESPTLPRHSWAFPAGRFHLQVCGKGFVARGWPGSTSPGDTWLIRAWACACTAPTRRLRTWLPGRP